MAGHISIDEGFKILEGINNQKKYPKLIRMLSGGLIGGFFTFMFGGYIPDFIASFAICSFSIVIYDALNKFSTPIFINTILCSALISSLSLLANMFFNGLNPNLIIIGSIMPLVPGVAITNAVRDLLSGDYIAGTARFFEALITASGIAFGAFMILQLSNIF